MGIVFVDHFILNFMMFLSRINMCIESCIVRNSQSQPCLHIQICIECTVFPELKKFTELHRCVGSICVFGHKNECLGFAEEERS